MNRTLPISTCAGLALCGLLAISASSTATVIIDTGSGNFSGDSNVIFTSGGNNGCGAGVVTGPATTVTGCLNDHHDYYVDFSTTSTGDLLKVNTSGNPSISAVLASNPSTASSFSNFTVSTHAGSFATYIVNLTGSDDGKRGAPNDGDLQISVDFFDVNTLVHTVQTLTSIFDLSENGSNWFRLSHDSNNYLFSSITFTAINFSLTSIEIAKFSQNRIGPYICDVDPEACQSPPNNPEPASIPEPAMLGLIGLGLLGLGIRRRRGQT